MTHAKTDAAFETLLNAGKPKVFNGQDYVLKIFFPFAVRSEAKGKVLTLPTEVKQKPGTWWVFGGYLAVYVETPICWDNEEEEPLSVREAEVTMQRIKEVLDKHEGKRYEFLTFRRLDTRTG